MSMGLVPPLPSCQTRLIERMRGDDPFVGMRNLKRFSDRAAVGDFLLRRAADIRDPNDHILSQEDFDEITDFNDLPTSLFACNVHQSVFEDEQGRILPLFLGATGQLQVLDISCKQPFNQQMHLKWNKWLYSGTHALHCGQPEEIRPFVHCPTDQRSLGWN
ncbi:calcipressin-2 isoform X4 [Carcharodon carcharias]|uniref:calcipressin-2 isoform X4 n=1 Tax=Carcharodon carcharias TaxID=13397 RepID=UPI001B7DAA0D|nr:calcipressin-2 isoform X4 [Carcharodon carcharias]